MGRESSDLRKYTATLFDQQNLNPFRAWNFLASTSSLWVNGVRWSRILTFPLLKLLECLCIKTLWRMRILAVRLRGDQLSWHCTCSHNAEFHRLHFRHHLLDREVRAFKKLELPSGDRSKLFHRVEKCSMLSLSWWSRYVAPPPLHCQIPEHRFAWEFAADIWIHV